MSPTFSTMRLAGRFADENTHLLNPTRISMYRWLLGATSYWHHWKLEDCKSPFLIPGIWASVLIPEGLILLANIFRRPWIISWAARNLLTTIKPWPCKHSTTVQGQPNVGDETISAKQVLYRRILSLLAYAKRPLRLEEVGEALAIIERPLRNVQSATFYCEDLSPANSTQLDGYELQDRFMPFLKFMPLEKGMKTGYLRLSHASVLEFLSASSASVISVSQGLLISPNIISDACLRYLSQNQYSFSTRNHESFPGARNMTGPIQGHHFLPYAAKYWHKHINESDPFPMDIAGAFLHSSQFISAIRSQSLLLDRQFNLYQDNASMKAKPASEKAPAKFELRENLQVIAGDYQKFVQEWSNFLKLGVTDAELHGAIEHCFWGALGPGNFLSEHGSVIERNQSFLLEMEIPIEDEKNQNAPLSYFQEAVSADGSCVSVWKMPVQR